MSVINAHVKFMCDACNGTWTVVVGKLTKARPRLRECGWTTTDDKDLCPNCSPKKATK